MSSSQPDISFSPQKTDALCGIKISAVPVPHHLLSTSAHTHPSEKHHRQRSKAADNWLPFLQTLSMMTPDPVGSDSLSLAPSVQTMQR